MPGVLRVAAACVLILGSTLLTAPRNPDGPVRLGVVPSIPSDSLQSELGPVTAYLGKKLGREVVLVVADDYGDISHRLEAGELEFAILFPLVFAQAHAKDPLVQLIGCSVRQGKAHYRGYIVTRQTSDIRSLAQLEGRSIGFVDPGSASGFYFPVQMFRKEGLIANGDDLPKFFSDVRFLQSHENVLRAVASGEVDSGAVVDHALARGVQVGVDLGSLRILARTDPIPHEAVVAASGVDPALRAAFRDALLSLDTRSTAGREVLRPMSSDLKLNGFVSCDEAVFAPLRETLDVR